jgi:hypothetical protein
MRITRLSPLLLLFAVYLLTGCSIWYTVDTDSTKKLKTDLTEMSAAITSVDVQFLRPDLYIDVYLNSTPDQQARDRILEEVKAFATVDNLNAIGQKVDWKQEPIWSARLFIYINKDKDSWLEYTYTAEYSTGNNAPFFGQTNNVDGYKTWKED